MTRSISKKTSPCVVRVESFMSVQDGDIRYKYIIFPTGGGGEIRTHGPVSRTPHFKCGALDHSATPPNTLRKK